MAHGQFYISLNSVKDNQDDTSTEKLESPFKSMNLKLLLTSWRQCEVQVQLRAQAAQLLPLVLSSLCLVMDIALLTSVVWLAPCK
jgi:hypothetical protein